MTQSASTLYLAIVNYFVYPGIVETVQIKSISIILDAIRECTGVTADRIRSRSRVREVVEARHLAIYFLRGKLKLTFAKIALLLNRHHSSIIYGDHQINDLLVTSESIQHKFTQIQSKL